MPRRAFTADYVEDAISKAAIDHARIAANIIATRAISRWDF